MRPTPEVRFTVSDSDFYSFFGEAEIDTAEWSADGLWLKIEATDGDDRVLAVVNAKLGPTSMRTVQLGDSEWASWGTWSLTGHTLYVVASSMRGDFEESTQDGIFAYDPVAGSVERLMGGYRVWSLSVTEAGIAARILQTSGDFRTGALVLIDPKTGGITWLLRGQVPESR